MKPNISTKIVFDPLRQKCSLYLTHKASLLAEGNTKSRFVSRRVLPGATKQSLQAVVREELDKRKDGRNQDYDWTEAELTAMESFLATSPLWHGEKLNM